MTASGRFGVGQSVLRREDDPLLRGYGRYIADAAPSGTLQAAVLRSPHAHAHGGRNVAWPEATVRTQSLRRWNASGVEGKRLGNYRRIAKPSSGDRARAEAVRPAITETVHLSTRAATDTLSRRGINGTRCKCFVSAIVSAYDDRGALNHGREKMAAAAWDRYLRPHRHARRAGMARGHLDEGRVTRCPEWRTAHDGECSDKQGQLHDQRRRDRCRGS